MSSSLPVPVPVSRLNTDIYKTEDNTWPRVITSSNVYSPTLTSQLPSLSPSQVPNPFLSQPLNPLSSQSLNALSSQYIVSGLTPTGNVPQLYGRVIGASVPHASPVSRIYPHVFDERTDAGSMLNSLQRALSDANRAIDAYGEPDINAVSTHLTNVAVIMKAAHALADFNKSLAGVLSFIRRATLTTPLEDITRTSLNALSGVVKSILDDPMINLDEASDLVERLSSEGWKGELEIVEALFAALLGDIEGEKIQGQLFPQGEPG